jgi:hypothetical protein
LLPVDPEYVEHKLVQLWRLAAHFRRRRARKRLLEARSMLRDPRVYELLGSLYADEDLLVRCGLTYPVAVIDRNLRALRPHDPILSPPADGWRSQSRQFVISKSAYRRTCQTAGSPVFPGETYRMVAIRTQPTGGVVLDCDIGRYDFMLDTCHALDWELLRTLHRHSELPASSERLIDALKMRKELSRRVPDPVRDGTGRSCAIGVSVLTTFYDGDEQYAWLRKRSLHGVAPGAGQLHVIPSFMLQPVHGYRDEEFCVLHNVLREFLEELFGVSAPEDAVYDWFLEFEPIRYLDELFRTGEADVWITGVAASLRSLRPDICVLLRIKTPRWYANHRRSFQVNEEFASMDELRARNEEFVPRIRISANEDDHQLLERAGTYPSEMTSAGAAGFWLGVDAIRTLTARESRVSPASP